MADGLNVVAIRIEHEGAIIVLVVKELSLRGGDMGAGLVLLTALGGGGGRNKPPPINAGPIIFLA